MGIFHGWNRKHFGEIRAFVVGRWETIAKLDDWWSTTKNKVINIFERRNENLKESLDERSHEGNISVEM